MENKYSIPSIESIRVGGKYEMVVCKKVDGKFIEEWTPFTLLKLDEKVRTYLKLLIGAKELRAIK